MMKLKILVVILVLLIFINLGTIGSYIYFRFIKTEEVKKSRKFGRSRKGGKEKSASTRIPDLKLNRHQRKHLNNLLKEFGTETRELHVNLRQLEKEAFDLLQMDSVVIEQVNEKLKEICDIRFQIDQKAIQKMIDAKRILTPEQQQHFFRALMQLKPRISDLKKPEKTRPPPLPK